jgi:cobalt/nickel transport protein
MKNFLVMVNWRTISKTTYFILLALLLSLFLSFFLAPYASRNPDGLEKIAQKLGFAEKTQDKFRGLTSPAPDYSLKVIKNPVLSTAISGAGGTLLMFILAWSFGKLLLGKNKPTDSNETRFHR